MNEEAKVMEFEKEEMMDQEQEQMQEGQEQTEYVSIETMEAINEAERNLVEKDLKRNLVYGFLAGLGIGGTIGFGVWFMERNNRKKLLKEIEMTNLIIDGIITGKETITVGKKNIELADQVLEDTESIVDMIEEHLDQVRIGKKEKARWSKALVTLVELSVNYNLSKVTERLKETATDENTEVIVEEK